MTHNESKDTISVLDELNKHFKSNSFSLHNDTSKKEAWKEFSSIFKEIVSILEQEYSYYDLKKLRKI